MFSQKIIQYYFQNVLFVCKLMNNEIINPYKLCNHIFVLLQQISVRRERSQILYKILESNFPKQNCIHIDKDNHIRRTSSRNGATDFSFAFNRDILACWRTIFENSNKVALCGVRTWRTNVFEIVLHRRAWLLTVYRCIWRIALLPTSINLSTYIDPR